MEKIIKIDLRNTATGEEKSFNSLEDFKKEFKEDYDLTLQNYITTYQKDEKSFLESLSFNFNACGTTLFKITDIKCQTIQKNGKPKTVANGEGSFYFSETLQRWIFQYTEPSGKRQTLRQKKNESERAFRKRVTDVKGKLDNGVYIAKSKDTFIEILTKYVKQKHKDGLTSNRSYGRELFTIQQIENTCSNFINKPIQKITVEDIEKSKEDIKQYSNESIGKIWSTIKKVFQIAYSRRKIQYNIMLDETLTKPISSKPNKKIKALTIEEENKLIDVLNNQEYNHKYRDIILLQLYTGMRIGEVLALSIDCIDLKNNTLAVYRTLTQDDNYHVMMGEHTKTYKKSSGTDNGKRTFPMTINVKNIITKIINNKISNLNGLLFWDNQNQTYITPSEINSYLKRINNKYHITSQSIHSHRLRHTFITRCKEQGVSVDVIKKIVGHVKESSLTDDVYTDVFINFMNQELKKIN